MFLSFFQRHCHQALHHSEGKALCQKNVPLLKWALLMLLYLLQTRAREKHQSWKRSHPPLFKQEHLVAYLEQFISQCMHPAPDKVLVLPHVHVHPFQVQVTTAIQSMQFQRVPTGVLLAS